LRRALWLWWWACVHVSTILIADSKVEKSRNVSMHIAAVCDKGASTIPDRIVEVPFKVGRKTYEPELQVHLSVMGPSGAKPDLQVVNPVILMSSSRYPAGEIPSSFGQHTLYAPHAPSGALRHLSSSAFPSLTQRIRVTKSISQASASKAYLCGSDSRHQ